MTRLLTGLAILLTLGLAACGGDTAEKNDYVKAVNKAQTDFADGINKAQAGATSDPKKFYTDTKASMDKIVADLKAIEAPDEVSTEHNTLVSEFEKFGSTVEKAGQSLESGDLQKLAAAQEDVARGTSAATTKISTTIQQINAKLQE